MQQALVDKLRLYITDSLSSSACSHGLRGDGAFVEKEVVPWRGPVELVPSGILQNQLWENLSEILGRPCSNEVRCV